MHHVAMRSALMSIKDDLDVKVLEMKISISLLRHVDLIPIDKAFFEAGTAAKVSKIICGKFNVSYWYYIEDLFLSF